jgi:hypothetical protein
MDDLMRTYAVVQRRYGRDVAQQAMWLTLKRHKTQTGAYLYHIARSLDRGGYHDALATPESANVWHREYVDLPLSNQRAPLWCTPIPSPERQALARETLRLIPIDIIEAAMERSFERRSGCEHSPRWWYLYRHGKDRSIKCRRCIAARMAQRRRVQTDGRSV